MKSEYNCGHYKVQTKVIIGPKENLEIINLIFKHMKKNFPASQGDAAERTDKGFHAKNQIMPSLWR